MKSKGPKDSPHVRVYFSEMESEAFKAMSLEGVFLLLLMKKEHRGRADNRFSLPYADIQRMRPGRCHPRKIGRAIFELETFGFIERITQGGLFKSASVYALSEKWKEISKDSALISQAKMKFKGWRKNHARKNEPKYYLANYKALPTLEATVSKK
jgi:hypothetical protein